METIFVTSSVFNSMDDKTLPQWDLFSKKRICPKGSLFSPFLNENGRTASPERVSVHLKAKVAGRPSKSAV